MAIMDVIEATQMRGTAHVLRYNNDDEAKSKTTREEAEENMTVEDRIIKAIKGIGGKPRIDIPIYSISINP